MCVFLSNGFICFVCTSVSFYVYWDVESYVLVYLLGGMCLCGVMWVFIVVCHDGVSTCVGA